MYVHVNIYIHTHTYTYIHIQMILIIWRVHICEVAYLLKFIYIPEINKISQYQYNGTFIVICRHAHSGENFE